MYVREDCYFWFFIEIFHFFSRYLVVGSRYDFFFGFNNMRRNTCRSGFVRYQAKTWKQLCVTFRGQGDAVRHIPSMNDSYGYTIVKCVEPHYSGSISQLAGIFRNKLTADAGWQRICIYEYVVQITIYVLCSMYYVHLDPNLPFGGAVQSLYITDPTQATCCRACSMCDSYSAMWATSHRSGIHLPWKS